MGVITESNSIWNEETELFLADFIAITDDMQVIFETSDFDGSGHLVEAAVDAFSVEDAATTSISNLIDENIRLSASPNPFSDYFTLRYDLEANTNDARLHIYNLLGQEVESYELSAPTGSIEVGQSLNGGLFLVQIKVEGRISEVIRLVKKG